MKTITIVVCIAAVIGLILLLGKEQVSKREIYIKNNRLLVEVANTPAEQMKGLMYRKKLLENEGMLFIFDRPGKHPFWMKNTYITLDILWINSEGTIVHIENSVPPCEESPCATYASESNNAKYVLEIKGGWAIAHDLAVGNKVEITL